MEDPLFPSFVSLWYAKSINKVTKNMTFNFVFEKGWEDGGIQATSYTGKSFTWRHWRNFGLKKVERNSNNN